MLNRVESVYLEGAFVVCNVETQSLLLEIVT